MGYWRLANREDTYNVDLVNVTEIKARYTAVTGQDTHCQLRANLVPPLYEEPCDETFTFTVTDPGGTDHVYDIDDCFVRRKTCVYNDVTYTNSVYEASLAIQPIISYNGVNYSVTASCGDYTGGKWDWSFTLGVVPAQPATIPVGDQWILSVNIGSTTDAKPFTVVDGVLPYQKKRFEVWETEPTDGPQGPQGDKGDKGDPGDLSPVDGGESDSVYTGTDPEVHVVGDTGEPAFETGWSSTTTKFWRVGNQVTVALDVQKAAGITAGLIFTLPEGFRPPTLCRFAVYDMGSNQMAIVESNGQVSWITCLSAAHAVCGTLTFTVVD